MLDRTDTGWMIERHTDLFHVVYRSNEQIRESIAENGLVSGTSRHYWHGIYRPRGGHVYLATAKYVKEARSWGKREYPFDVYAVESAQLVPSRVNPDEDHFIADDWITKRNMIGDRQACCVFQLPFPPTVWMWDWAAFLKLHSLPSYGEWADAVDLGRDPRQAAYSLRRGSIAYRGDIPPTALRHVFSSDSASNTYDEE